jgi:hypothetical protein
VSGRIAIRGNRILSGQRDYTVNDEKGAKRVVARQSRAAGQFDRLSDEAFLSVHRLLSSAPIATGID